jgi:hypothetical protein
MVQNRIHSTCLSSEKPHKLPLADNHLLAENRLPLNGIDFLGAVIP